MAPSRSYSSGRTGRISIRARVAIEQRPPWPTTRLTLPSITVDRDSHVEVTLRRRAGCAASSWSSLRLACPCAGCRNAREQGRRGVAAGRPVGAGALPITDAELVGAWGLGITWSDGHSTGIYPFESLRRWCDAGSPAAAFGPRLRSRRANNSTQLAVGFRPQLRRVQEASSARRSWSTIRMVLSVPVGVVR